MNRKLLTLVIATLVSLLATACSPAQTPQASYLPGTLKFSGERAYAIEEEFVTTYTDRVSGTEQSRMATEWIRQQFEAAGWSCAFDVWEIINYSRPVELRNVVCKLQGESDKEILVVAHHDIAPTTIQGADNDGSGVAILLHLAEIFAAEPRPRYTLVFASTDAEEYGMIGSRRYIETHPNTEDIIAGVSLDNLGMDYYNIMNIELVGQFSRYGPIWLPLTAREAARAADGLWEVNLRAPIDQVLDQAVPLSFMDQGPMVAAGVPAIGFLSGFPPEKADENYRLWHDPDDSMEHQSPQVLGQSGAIAEALVRQLMSMESFPDESGPYLYLDNSQQALRGAPLYLIFAGFVGLYFVGSYFIGAGSLQEKFKAWRDALPHYLGLWLPLVMSILLLYLFAAVGIMDKWHLYPATTKDPALLNPRWPAVVLCIIGLAFFLYIGRQLVRRYSQNMGTVQFRHIKSMAFLIIGLAGIYIIAANPFSLLLCVPTLCWFLIGDRQGIGKVLDVILFLVGALFLYAIIYFFGFVRLRYGFVFLWMFMNMFSSGMISFPAAVAGLAVLAAGLSMVVNPPKRVAVVSSE